MLSSFDIQKLYLAYFGRPADPAAVTGWAASGLTESQLVLIFVDTDEYRINTLSDPAIESPDGTVNLQGLITELYQRLGGRDPAQVEVDGWTNAVATGAVNLDYLALTLANAIINLPDGTDLENNLRRKIDASNRFTGDLASNSSKAQLYSGFLPIQIGIDYLDSISASTSTSQIAQLSTAAINSLPPLGAEFTLASSANSVLEGNAVTVTLQAFPLNEPPVGQVYSYTIIGSGGFDANDLESGQLTGTVAVDAFGVANINIRVKQDARLEPGESFTVQVNGFSSYQTAPISVIDNPPPIQLQVAASSTAVNEGETLTFFITTENVAPGTSLQWNLAGVTSSDINGANPFGSVTVDAQGNAQVTFNISRDLFTEGPETVTFTATGLGLSESATSVINDTSLTPSLQVAASSTAVNEGGTLTFFITTVSVAPGTSLQWNLAGVTSSDINGANPFGTVTVDAQGNAQVTFNISEDLTTEGLETVTFSASGAGLFGTASSVINDTSTTPVPALQVNAGATAVNEGGTLTFFITTENFPPGTSLLWTLAGVTSSDINGANPFGTVIVDAQGNAQVTFNISEDLTTEGPETVTFTATGLGLSESATSVINDTSKTPGPSLQVQASATAVNEGGTLTFFVTTENFPPGTILAWTLAGVNPADINGANPFGNVTVNAQGNAQVTFNISADLTTEGPETVTFTATGLGLSESATSVINDTSLTPALPTSVLLTTDQDISGLTIIATPAVETFTFIGNTKSGPGAQPTLGQGDQLDGRPAGEAILQLNAFNTFDINNFSTLGVDTFRLFVNASSQADQSSVNMSGAGRDPDQGFAVDPDLAIKNYEIFQSNLKSLLFSDIQAITIDGEPLSILVNDASTCFEFNFDQNALAGSSDSLNLTLIETPIDPSGIASGFDFTQGPFSVDADIEELRLFSEGPTDNVLSQLSVGDALERLFISGTQSFELTTDLGTNFLPPQTEACGPNGNSQVYLIDASELCGDLTLTYTSLFDGVVEVFGAKGQNKLTFDTELDSGNPAQALSHFYVEIENDEACGLPNDTVTTTLGNDTVLSGIGNDYVHVGVGNNVVDAGSGNDTVSAGSGNDSILGGTGNDSITAGDGRNTVDAGDGNDTVAAGSGNDSVIGGIGNDSICVDGGNNTVVAGEGDDTVGAGSGNDSVLGGAGNDLLVVGNGNNTVVGGEGKDSIYAGSGNDSLVGDSQDDVIYAGGGNNVVRGGTGNDLIQIGGGRDVVLAGLGEDTVFMRLEDLSGADQISGDESAIWDFQQGGPAPAGYGISDYIVFTSGGTLGLTETAGVQNIEGFKLTQLPGLDIFPTVEVCGEVVGNDDSIATASADYTIVLSQEVVRKSNEILQIDPFAFQDQRRFTIDATDLGSPILNPERGSGGNVTIDLLNLQQGDGFGNRTGFRFLGQSDFVQDEKIELIILDQDMVSSTLELQFNEQTIVVPECWNDPVNPQPVGLQNNFIQFVAEDTNFVADEDDLVNISGADRIILSAGTSILNAVFTLELSEDFLRNQIVFNSLLNRAEDFVITPDASLFPGATLNLFIESEDSDSPWNVVETGGTGGRLIVRTSGMLNVNYFDIDTGAAINFVDLPSWVVQADGLFFTQNADDIQGGDCDDVINAFQVSDLNPADSVNGGGGVDQVLFDFGVFNTSADFETSATVRYPDLCPDIAITANFDFTGLTLSAQLNLADFDNIEEFVFDPKNQDGVRFNGFNLGGNQDRRDRSLRS